MKARLVGSQGDRYTFVIDEDIDLAVLRKKFNQSIYADVHFLDERKVTENQRRFAFALHNDVSEYTGYPPDYVKAWLYEYHMMYRGKDRFTLSAGGTLTEANDYLEDVIAFCFDNDIPFSGKHWQLDRATSKMLYLFMMKRICWICGKPHSDLAHVETVGSGRNRKQIDHTEHRFMMLCREHHTEQHLIGIETFLERYHIKPIKLKNKDLKQLGVV